MDPRLFNDRHDAGRRLAAVLAPRLGGQELIVLGLPRGGVPVAFEVAQALGAPLDVFIVRKLGLPGQEELAMGAIAGGGVCVLNEEVLRLHDIPPAVVENVIVREKAALAFYERAYREGLPPPDVHGRTVILIDDGLATGSTMRAAVAALRMVAPGRIVVAVPVAAQSTCRELAREVDELVCLITPEPFYAVGNWYRDFSQTRDEEVRMLLRPAPAG